MAKHSHHFFLIAIICGLISITAVIRISAQTTTSLTPSTTLTTPTYTTTTPTTNTATTSQRITVTCSYQTGDWSSCVNGVRTRTVTATPSGCIESSTKPKTSETCTNTTTTATYPNTTSSANPTTTAVTSCNYYYSSWSTCNSSGYQTRSVTSTYPAGCVKTTDPAISRSCTYTSAQTVTCSYNYSSWSACSSSGKQTRTVVSTYPENCTRSTSPLLEQSCTYYNTTTGSESANTITRTTTASPATNSQTTLNTTNTTTNASGTNTTTQPFIFSNVIDGTVIEKTFNIEGKVPGASSVEYYIAPAGSNTYKYLGTAQNSSTNIWVFGFDSTKNPNGLFYLKARIKNVYGSYESDKVSLTVLNEVPEEVSVSSENATSDSNATTISNNQETNKNGLTSNEWQQKYFDSESCRDESVCGGNSDPDKDGLNNNDEFRYGTDPKNPDTDKDGYLDGDEVKNGFNPLKASPGDKSDKIVFESPKESGEVKKDIYVVNNVELISSEDGNNKFKISGKALPNSFVTVYIYSDPIILTIKTDEDGNWSYELDKELEDGNHEAYVAVTDNTGKITGKSEPIAFVKSAQAVTVIPPAEASAGERAQSPTQVWMKRDYLLYIAFGFSALAIIFGVIGLFLHRIRNNTLKI